MVEDIRNTPAAEYWDRMRTMMDADGLMTYRYLGRTVNTLEEHDTMRIRGDMRNPAGGLMAAPLAIAAPETGGFTDVESVPAPVTYSLHLLDDGRDVSEIRIRHSGIHTGRTMGFGQGDIVDAADEGRVIAVVSGTGVKLAAAPPDFRPIDPAPDIPDSPALPPLHEVFGARPRAEGVWELPELDARLASTSASLHLGPIHVVFEAAAMDLASSRAGGDHEALQIEDWNVMFVARGTRGPFVVTGDPVTGGLGRTVCRMTMRDEGDAGRVVAWASAVFRPLR
jgi:acyl-coenzyme A thioesterase PaaI-like protein